ncbi:Vitamin K-dependent gamma-carboxylase [Hymenobacter gelipurpurascens]|uniref:Vitamin K-dependent gamma-carboxylase n=1 Tax=Hymenobacter gelipurpurascens TaxID=89968 RepID=A0A212U8H3_9BACT|nr:HTTM domain-containing protein [Hymenobacter gelipurpurascens]SNC74558.1 Vitamin K-dependent gamma-carboxylase [Hymenobacter gelipurpurascens]
MLRFLALIRSPFVLDLRALALLRAAVAAVILLDLGIRATDLEAHYSNMGVLPLSVLYDKLWNPYQFSLHNTSGLWQVQALIFLVAAAAAVSLLLGHRTRLSTFISWVLLISVQNRNPMIVQGGDDLLRMLLFWGLFLPWGRVYSVDARKQPAPAELSYFSAATVAYIVQIALVYWCTALLKSSPEWNRDGTALYYALSLDQVLMPGGRFLYQFPAAMRFLTLATYYTEMLLPFVLFIPFRVPWWRLLFVFIIYGFHLGISLTLFVGLFFLINMASVLGLLPPVALDWLEKRVVPRARQLGPRVAARLAPLQPRWVAWRQCIGLRIETSWTLSGGLRRLLRQVREGVVVGVLLYVCWWNLDSIVIPRYTMSDPMRWLGYLVRVDQHWGMFAPSVFKDDGWYILNGTTTTGQHLDLNRGGAPLTYTKPASVVSLFKNDRWRKYSENYLFVNNAYMRPYYCNYLLRIWHENPHHPPLKQLEVIYMKEVTQPNYQPVTPTREVLCSCAPTP